MAEETYAIQRRNAGRLWLVGAGAKAASGWRSASQIKIAALSVITSPPGKTSTGTWPRGLTLSTAGVWATSCKTEPPITSYDAPISASAASTGTEPEPGEP